LVPPSCTLHTTMPMPRIVTTSWDDGDPSDLKVAELLRARALSGTFYVPFIGPHGRRLLWSIPHILRSPLVLESAILESVSLGLLIVAALIHLGFRGQEFGAGGS
jgi:hypothetical protein